MMNIRSRNLLSAAILVAMGMSVNLVFAEQAATTCPGGGTSTSCTATTQSMGDVDNGSAALGTQSNSSNSGTSSASNSNNAIGNSLAPSADNKTQLTQNADNTTTGTISGGNTKSNAAVGNTSATGNLSNNDNRSSVGNTTATTGPNTSNSGDNHLTNGSNTATTGNNTNQITATGGQGGSGGQGGQGGAGGQGGLALSGSYSGGNSVQGGNQRNEQGQGQQQGIDDSGNSASLSGVGHSGNSSSSSSTELSHSGNSAIADTGNSSQSQGFKDSGNSETAVDASDNSSHTVNYKSIFIPPVVPAMAPSVVGSAQVSTVVGVCGPLAKVVTTPVDGRYIGFWRTKNVELGTTDRLEIIQPVSYERAALDDGSVHYIGRQPVYFVTVVSVAGGRNLALGGGSGGGSWGQAGGGSSQAMQQMVTHIELQPCDAGTFKVAPAPVAIQEHQEALPVVHKIRG